MPDPTTPRDVEQLEEQLSTPTPRVIDAFRRLSGDVLVLGVGGKMGPTLARMAKRAGEAAGIDRRVIGVSRFSSPGLREQLDGWGVETVACDLLDEESVAALPNAPNVVCMTGFKFGATANPPLTWAMNCYVPALISRRYRDSRIVAFSSGNVYGMVPVDGRGSAETDELDPQGEYAITVLGRERIFEYFSRELNIPTVLLRLNYATELRYGVLVDIAQKVWEGEPFDVSVGYVNVIWQQEANAMALEGLLHTETPPRVLNIAGSEFLRVRDVAEEFGRLMNKQPSITGQEGPTAFLNNATASYERLGEPTIHAEQMIRWTADWIMRGGDSFGKPTHFESTQGKY